MSWEVFDAGEAFDRHRTTWDAFNATYYRGNAYCDARFIGLLLRYFGTGKERLALHRTADRIDAMLLLTPARKGLFSLFAPSQTQISPVFVDALEALRPLCRKLPGICLGLDLLNQDPDYSAFGNLPDSNTVRNQDHALTISIEVSGEFDDYWKQRSKKLRSNIQRYQNRAKTAGLPLSFVRYERPEDMADAVARYGTLESSGWKAKEGTQVSADNVQGHFYTEVLTQFAQTGAAVVYELYLGERLAASRLCIRSDEMMIMLKTSYDEALSEYAVGRLLLYEVLKHEFTSKRVRRIEFYTNATQDQLSWSTHQRTIRHVTLYRFGWIGRAHAYVLNRRKARAAAPATDQEHAVAETPS